MMSHKVSFKVFALMREGKALHKYYKGVLLMAVLIEKFFSSAWTETANLFKLTP